MSGRPLRSRLARLGPNLVLLAALVFFTAPLVSTARQALQTVPMPLLDWNTVFDKWTIDGVKRIFDEESFWLTLRTSLELAAATVVITLALLVPTALYVHLRLPRARAIGRVPDGPPVRRPAGCPGGGCCRVLPGQRALVLHLHLRPRAVLRGHGVAVHLPGHRRRDQSDRCAHAGRRLAQSRCRMGYDDASGCPAQLGLESGLGLVSDGHRRAGRVHHCRDARQADISPPSRSSSSVATSKVESRWRC